MYLLLTITNTTQHAAVNGVNGNQPTNQRVEADRRGVREREGRERGRERRRGG